MNTLEAGSSSSTKRLARLLVKALALGDLETVEHCALALVAEGEEVHTDYEGDKLVQVERHLYAFLYALPPFHRNPCRREFVEARLREQRLVGCYVAIATKSADPEHPPTICGTLIEDQRDAWTVRTRQQSANGEHSVETTIVVPLAGISACELRPNDAQYRAYGLNPDAMAEADLQAQYLGQPLSPWFRRLAPLTFP